MLFAGICPFCALRIRIVSISLQQRSKLNISNSSTPLTADHLPKTLLYVHAGKAGKTPPAYETQQCDKLFRAICSYDGQRYSSTFWEKNKKQAEQGAALVALLSLGRLEEEALRENGSLLN